jgi:hypothetical protein
MGAGRGQGPRLRPRLATRNAATRDVPRVVKPAEVVGAGRKVARRHDPCCASLPRNPRGPGKQEAGEAGENQAREESRAEGSHSGGLESGGHAAVVGVVHRVGVPP